MAASFHRYALALAIAAGLALGARHAVAQPIGTAFTYQGVLLNSGIAPGPVDLQFRLFDAALGGAQVGGLVQVTNITPVNGLFTVSLDFGTTAFTGNSRWVEVRARPASVGAYTTLSPRQSITPSPYAIYSENGGLWQATGSAISNTNTGFVGINRTTPLTGAEVFGITATVGAGLYGGMYIRTTTAGSLPFYGYSTPTTSCWTYLDGTEWKVYNGGDAMVITNAGKVGIGIDPPTTKLYVSTDTGGSIVGKTTDDFGIAVFGLANQSQNGNSTGVRGEGNTGVFGTCILDPTGGVGVYGSNGGSNTTGYAGYFSGRVNIAGNLSKSGGAFKIDHPLDPANKYLYHSFVESPDMKNIYDGVITLDASGTATITLPDWFDALNSDFRYQLTCIGGYAPVYIAEKVKSNHFKIAGGSPGLEVSWQLTGVRQDAWAQANRIPVEEYKSGPERGRYIHPELFGADPALAVDAAQARSRTPEAGPAETLPGKLQARR